MSPQYSSKSAFPLASASLSDRSASALALAASAAPFGGYGKSGWGREGGHEALQEYTQIKNVLVELG